jgi:hypothetical protein
VNGPIRTKPSARFIKSRAKKGQPLAGRIDKALIKFHKNPESPDLNFEAFGGFFTIRVNRNFRILLSLQEDKDGPYYLIVDVDDHDNTYS